MKIRITDEDGCITWVFDRNPLRNFYVPFFLITAVVYVIAFLTVEGSRIQNFVLFGLALFLLIRSLLRPLPGTMCKRGDVLVFFTGRPDMYFGIHQSAERIRRVIFNPRKLAFAHPFPFFFPKLRTLEIRADEVRRVEVVPYGVVYAICFETNEKHFTVMEGVDEGALRNLSEKLSELVKC